jgi:hypothetical protein
MMARRGALGLLAGSIAVLLGGCGLFFRSGSYRFRMTVDVETPEGVRTGSSVYEVTAHKSPALTSEEHEGGGGLRGEAVVVDLPGGPLFVTLKMPVAGEDLGEAATFALAPDTKRGNVDAYVAAVGELGGMSGSARAELPREDWPLMVRFRDTTDPTSVVEVDPEVVGVHRITIKTTDDDMSIGIDKRLGWLHKHIGSLVRQPRNILIKEMTAAALLTVRDFSTELNK